MKRILASKHWQLFLLIVITGSWTSPSPLKEIINSISLVTFTIWVYAIGIYGQEEIKTLGLSTSNSKLFRINALLIPLVTILILIISIIAPDETDEVTLTWQKIVFFPMALYLIFAIFQVAVFACKTLTTIELKKEVVFNDYFLNLILMTIFLFVGIWILQPKITRLIYNNSTNL